MDSNSYVASVAQSNTSVTKSHVSQVDFKFQSNETKKKLRSLLKGVDHDKTGMVKNEVFFQLLKLHKVELSNAACTYLTKNFSKSDQIQYKDALNQLTIDLDAAGRVDEDGPKAKIMWTVQALAKKAAKPAKIGDDSIS